MTAHVIDGRKIATSLKAEVAVEVQQVTSAGRKPMLATLLVGDDFSSITYERRIGAMAAELHIPHRKVRMPATSTVSDLLAVVHALNQDPAISGILMLRPFPAHVPEVQLFAALSPIKDVEAVHPENAGLLALGTPRYVPSTAAAVFVAIDDWLDSAGEDSAAFYHRSLIVVVGRSNNVGKPLVSLAYDKGAAVESVDEWASKENRLGWHTRRANILVVAAGVPALIRAEHVRAGAIVIDVGINPVPGTDEDTARIVGDVAFEEVAARARVISPVPGGIGPITDVLLLRNTVAAAAYVDRYVQTSA